MTPSYHNEIPPNVHLAVLPRLFGNLCYYSPNTKPIKNILPLLSDFDVLWQDFVHNIPQSVSKTELKTDLNESVRATFSQMQSLPEYDFSILFEGQGKMPAPPWGSVYLNHENVLMGETTLAYRAFLKQHDLTLNTGINEPEDQFGLMLLALAYFLEHNDRCACKILLEQHLLPFAFRYLECVEHSGVTGFYLALAEIIKTYLQGLMLMMNLTPVSKTLYF